MSNQKIIYTFSNVFGKRISDEKFAKIVEVMYNQVVIWILKSKKMLNNKDKKFVECEKTTEKGKIICSIDPIAANEVNPQVIVFLIEQYKLYEPLLLSSTPNVVSEVEKYLKSGE